MATYRCVGRGVTDSNGVAHLTHDCSGNPLQSSGYVGSGKGQTQFITSLDNPSQINDGSLQSETFVVLDATYKDTGTDVPKTATWYNQDNAFTVTPSTDGTLISCSATALESYFADGNSFSTSYKFTAPLCVEVDVESVTGDVTLALMSNISPTISITRSCHLKMIWDGSKVEKYVDGVLTGTTQNITQTPVAIGFRMTNGSLTYKNFVIYPI